METLANKSIGAIVAGDYRTASVFQKYGIDFCCKGGKTIQEACETKKLDTAKVEKEVRSVLENKEAAGIDYNSWPLDLLADYIEKKHHRYVTDKVPVLNAYLELVRNVHGDKHPELFEIYTLFLESAEELLSHMKNEELMLFPFIRQMVQASAGDHAVDAPAFGTVKNPIEVMMRDHENEGERFVKIAELSKNYMPPADACPTYKVALATLKEFEKGLHTHIHLENNILFPKSIVLEKELDKATQV